MDLNGKIKPIFWKDGGKKKKPSAGGALGAASDHKGLLAFRMLIHPLSLDVLEGNHAGQHLTRSAGGETPDDRQ